jgi:formate dehydrogenase subunit gamma
MSGETVEVRRYSAGQRMNHWVAAGLFVLLALSGMALFDPGLFFLTDLFGGGQTTRAVHPWFGVVFALSFLGLLVRFAHHNIWGRGDARWMCKIGAVLGNREEELPEVGRYNAGQKLVFWAMVLLTIVMLVTGLVIWDVYFQAYTSIPTKRLAVLIHSVAAILFILVLFVHVYAAIWVRGTMRGMLRGTVTAGWAWRHHRKWLREEAARQSAARTR